MPTATYSPEDNKLRLYPGARLPEAVYARVRAAGFIWAPKQGLFVAPAWSPEREDLLINLCGEIDDEDTSLVERAQQRAERFEDYSERRLDEAHAAKEAVGRIADQIPFGQPILVGHHSEKRARRDAEKIGAGMKQAVRLWETSQYWEDRAQGAIRHAKYKERPDVRHRRIKTIEADIRRCKGEYTPADNPPHYIMQSDGQYVWCGPKGRGGRWVKVASLPAIEQHYQRWIAHYENRLRYEKAMLGEQGGIVADRFDLQVGGQILAEGLWLTILKLNRSGGQLSSVSTNNTRWPRVVPIEDIRDYKAPTAELAAKAKAAKSLPPIFNYDGPGFLHITQEQWDKQHKDYKGTRVVEATADAVKHRIRYGFFGPSKGFGRSSVAVFITDAKEKRPLAPAESAPVADVKPTDLPVEKDLPTAQRQTDRILQARAEREADESTDFAKMRDSLRRGGVKVVSAPQLFPTPAALADQVVSLADLCREHRILEPSAGTGSLMAAMLKRNSLFSIQAVEINPGLAEQLRGRYARGTNNCDVRCCDFLDTGAELGEFDRIVMNPPFENGADIKHINHALAKLRPGGRLVAICANGPRQREALKDRATDWIDLPAGSFAESGTNVNAAIVLIDV